MRRGEIWWASLQDPQGSGPGYRRPVVIIWSDSLSSGQANDLLHDVSHNFSHDQVSIHDPIFQF